MNTPTPPRDGMFYDPSPEPQPQHYATPWPPPNLNHPAPPSNPDCPPYATLRDQFAMAALTGIIAREQPGGARRPTDVISAEAYNVADAMLKARETNPNTL